MILNERGCGFDYEETRYVIGQTIVGTDASEYKGLFGVITEIRTGDDKETENDTPDLYCSFEPPELPCEIKRLEEVFSDLYGVPKRLDDIILDLVIMAPEMVKPMPELAEDKRQPIVFVLCEDWAVDDDHGSSVMIFTDVNYAKLQLEMMLREERSIGCIERWSVNESMVEDSSEDSYECYLNGDYNHNHYALSIVSMPLNTSEQFMREVFERKQSSYQLEDFVSQIDDWDEIQELNDDQYQRLIHDSRFPERFQNALGKNDLYWEAYWETMSETAYTFIKQFIKEEKERITK